jgi:hypothetical protein
MIMGLISLTVLSIASLMILFPEKHSLDIYKASILELSWKWPDTVVIDIVSPWGSQEPIPSPEEVILEETKEENNPSISSISTSQEKSKEILRQHLLNKYK